MRVVLLILAFVPSAAMVALLAIDSGQLYNDWHTAINRENSVVSSSGTVPTTTLYYALQQERQLSAAAIAEPHEPSASAKTCMAVTEGAT